MLLWNTFRNFRYWIYCIETVNKSWKTAKSWWKLGKIKKI